MPRPSYITNEDIDRWDKNITDSKDLLIEGMIKSSGAVFFKELLYAGAWLNESLQKLGCSQDLIFRIQFEAGRYCFGRDIWDAHAEFLDAFKNNNLIFEKDTDEF